MTTHVERSIEVEVPVRTAYDQWTQFEEFPRFMSGVQEVRQIGDALTHWVAEIGGVRREWDAAILEQVPDQKVAWAATTGATNAGAVYFQAVGAERTQVRLTLDYEPEGIVERVADVLDVVQRQAVADLDRFKEFIEQQGSASGGWRGRVDDGDLQGGAAGAGAAGHRAPDIPGDVVAVGPTGDTHGTLDTEVGGAPVPTSVPDEGPGVGHSGDPVAVDPTPSTGRPDSSAGADPTLTRTPSGVPVEGDPLVVDPQQINPRVDAVGRGSMVVDPAPVVPRAGANSVEGDPVAVDPAPSSGRQGTAAEAEPTLTRTPSGVPVEGDPVIVDPEQITARTDAVETGPVAADPAPAIPRTQTVDGDPVAVDPAYAATGSQTTSATTSAAGAAGFGTDTGLRSDDHTSGAPTGDPEARTAERPEETMNDSRSGTGDAAGFEESRAGFDESEQVVAGRDAADEDEDEVVERDFANRSIVRENVQRDFANREITPQDVAHGSVGTGERAAGTSAREGMEGDTGFQGTESMPDPARSEPSDVVDPEGTRRVADPRTDV